MTGLLYVDLETGGIPASTGIYEVGLIATENGRILETLTIGKVINPNRLSEGMGQGYACISDDEEYINQFKQFVAKYPYPFVAHNAKFDKGFLVHYGWVERNAVFHDTLTLFRNHIPKTEIENHKLGTIMDYYGVQVDGTLHTAISDLKGLVECVNKSGVLGEFSWAVGKKPLTNVDRYILENRSQINVGMSPEQIYDTLTYNLGRSFKFYTDFEDFVEDWFGDDDYDEDLPPRKSEEYYKEYFSTLMQGWVVFYDR